MTALPIRSILLLNLFLICSFGAWAQKSLFVTYNVEQGLGQSQATGLAQDNFHNLWVSHLGGISRFDGKRFTNYTTADGLQSNFCNTVLVDQTENVWIGTHTGLSVYDGRVFKNFPLTHAGHSAVVTSIQSDRINRVWALAEGELYQADVKQCRKIAVPFGNKRILAIGLDGLRELIVAVEGTGVFGLNGTEWRFLHPFDFVDEKGLKVRRLYTGPSGHLYFVSNKGVFVNKNKGWESLSFDAAGQVQAVSVLEDEQSRIWIATTKGVYRFAEGIATHFDAKKGFTDHAVYNIVKDAEGNFWFSTIGSGVIKYYESNVLYFDKELLHHIGVSGIAKTTDGIIWFGTYGGGFRSFDGKSLKEYHIPDKLPAAQIINFCLADKTDGIWIGTQGGGLWYFKKGNFRKIAAQPAVDNQAFYSGHINDSGRVVFATQQGLYEYENGVLKLIDTGKIFANTVAFIGNDSILVGTPQGPILVYKGAKAVFPVNEQLAKATVLSIVRHRGEILIGSADKGLFVVSLRTNTIRQFDIRHGLSSNSIYAMAVDPQGRIWISTGNYLNHFRINERQEIHDLVKVGKSKGILSPEGNMNSLLIADSIVWAGNLNGLNLIPLGKEKTDVPPLKVMVTDVRLFSAGIAVGPFADSIRRYYPVPQRLRLPHNKNHLTFSFHAVSLTDPDQTFYQYRIKGVDKEFSLPTSNEQVVYSALPPGDHILEVKAVNAQGGQSPVTQYTFTILAPFYQLWYFQLLFFLLFVGLVVLLVHLRHKWMEKRKRRKEEARQAELLLVRRRTAEDFHDDIGNKLTRINVLTEVLKNKMSPHEDAKTLIEQIQENTTGLYSSSKDLIWSLSNEEGSLYDLYARLIHFGKSLFQNTKVLFEYSEKSDVFQIFQINPETSRNATLMIKEAMNNALKHADADKVRLDIAFSGKGAILKVTDNGKGFATSKAVSQGYGLGNLRSRAERIGANLIIESGEGEGTTITIQISLSKNA